MFDAQAQHSPQFMLSRPGTFLASELLRLSRARETMTVTALWIAFLLRDILFYSSFYLFGSDFQQGHTEMPSTCGWQSHVEREPRVSPPRPLVLTRHTLLPRGSFVPPMIYAPNPCMPSVLQYLVCFASYIIHCLPDEGKGQQTIIPSF